MPASALKVKKKNHSNSDSDDSDQDSNQDTTSQGNNQELLGWGSKRSTYYHDSASDYDSENERQEEEEAKRIQLNQLKDIDELDFMGHDFDELLSSNNKKSKKLSFDNGNNDYGHDDLSLMEPEKIRANIHAMSTKEQLKLMKSTMPQVLYYCKQFKKVLAFLESIENESSTDGCESNHDSDDQVSLDLQKQQPSISEDSSLDTSQKSLPPQYENAVIVARLYLAHMTFYFSLVVENQSSTATTYPTRSTGIALDASTSMMLLKTHPVLEKIEVLEGLFEVALNGLLMELDQDEENTVFESDGMDDMDAINSSHIDSDFDSNDNNSEMDSINEMDSNDEMDLSEDQTVAIDIDSNDEMDSSDLEQDNQSETDSESKKTLTFASTTTSDTLLYDPTELMLPKDEYIPIKEKSRKKEKLMDQYGEVGPLSRADLKDKLQAKKSIQFHVSQADSALARKNLVRLSQLGDSDLPYKSKEKKSINNQDEEEIPILDRFPENGNENGEKLLSSLEKSVMDIYGEISDHSSEPDDDEYDRNEEEDDQHDSEDDQHDSEDEYLQKIKSEKMKKRIDREELYKQIYDQPFPMEPVQEEIDLPMDTKRKATYRILKNRGLTPHRKKENKNPRVKKRMKYDKALKKLSSVRRVAIDKVKVSTSQYGGEATGIKANLSRSVKF